MQFNVKPFIDKVSENQEIQNSKKKKLEWKNALKSD